MLSPVLQKTRDQERTTRVAAVFFYLFSSVMIASAFVVIFARNPVISVLFLILAFCNGAGLFLLAGAEFLAMILIVVYVGAVAVLFLFVVMMLDVDFAELKQGFQKYLPAGAVVGIVVLSELGFVAIGWQSASSAHEAAASPIVAQVTNTAALGQVLYTKYVIFFQASALVLLTAMIGAIVLTLHHRPSVKRQKIAEQNARTRENVIEIKKVPSRAGV
jgi:NADH-quinone oxidoreductase subunit J